jgi:tetratricopeptide (TPR) repeat protein
VDGRYPLALAHSGNPDEAIRMLDHIFRRNPFHRPIYFSFLANAYYLAKRYEDALEMSRTAVDRLPAIYQAQAWYAASAAQAGLNEEAGSAAAAVLRLRPNFTIGDFLRTVSLANEEQSVRLEDGLLKAGLPR